MNILFLASAGKLDYYLEDFAFFLKKAGSHSDFFPLNQLGRTTPFNFFLLKQHKRELELKSLIKQKKSDILVINSSRSVFNMKRLKSIASQCKIVLYDMEGPNYSGFKNPEWIKYTDLVITVSRYSARILSERFSNVVYLPHAVNTERFFEVDATPDFHAPIAFVGRPTPHRNDLLSSIANAGYGNDLRLYGSRWTNPNYTVPSVLRHCCSYSGDVHGKDLLSAISGANIFVNILQDQFKDKKTLMNLQSFMVPACRRCLLAEYTEELPETFEIGKEVLSFRSVEELIELVSKYAVDRGGTKRIGDAAWKRCIQCHTLELRAKQMLALLNQL